MAKLSRIYHFSPFLSSNIKSRLLSSVVSSIIFIATAPAHSQSPRMTLQEALDTNCVNCSQQSAYGQTLQDVNFETLQECHPQRHYVTEWTDQVQGFYTKDIGPDDLSRAEFPRKCVAFTLKSFVVDIMKATQKPSNSFGYCETDKGIPKHGRFGVCVTQDYVNMIYNSYLDAADCLGFSQKMMIPKLFNESGFHVNTFSSLRVRWKDSVSESNRKGTISDPISIESVEKNFTDLEKEFSMVILPEDSTEKKLKLGKFLVLKKYFIYEEKIQPKINSGDLDPKNEADAKWIQNTLDETLQKNDPEFFQKFYKNLSQWDSWTTVIGGDTGAGQMTAQALQDIRDTIEHNPYRELLNSSKPSCKRIRDAGVLVPAQKIDIRLANRCSLLKGPENPLRSFVYAGVLYHNNKRNILNGWNSQKVPDLVAVVNSLRISDADKNFLLADSDTEKIREILTILSYNSGPGKAVMYFKNWLLYRLEYSKKLAKMRIVPKKDFNFGEALPERMIHLGQEQKKLAQLTPEQIQSLQDEATKLYQELKTESNQDIIQSKKQRIAEITNFGIYNLSFPMYLRIYRQGWAKGYLSYIKDFANILDRNLGKGVCTEDNFLSL